MVMDYVVKVSRVEEIEQAKSIVRIESQNHTLKSSVRILGGPRHMKIIRCSKTRNPLPIVVVTPRDANILVQEGLIDNLELKDIKLYIED